MVERQRSPGTIDIAPVDPQSDDAQWCFGQYFRELDSRFEGGFDPARSLPAESHELLMPRGVVVLARLNGAPVGCGALKFHEGWAELKRMWIRPDMRGIGLGARILQTLEQMALTSNALVVRLETNRTLSEAIALYRRSGYAEVEAFNAEPYAHHWFEKRLR